MDFRLGLAHVGSGVRLYFQEIFGVWLFKKVGRDRERGFKNFLQNFGDESQFWRFWDFGIDFKILKKVCDACSPILGQIFQNFDFDHRILLKSQSYDKPPWRNFDFLSNFVEIENFGF